MDKSKFYNISGKDIRRLDIIFNNGECIIIPKKQLNKLDINLTSIVDVKDDPIFKHAFLFSVGSIEINMLFFRQMLGNDVLDKLMYRNGINSLVIEYDNSDYKIKSDIPMMLCLVETKATPDFVTKLKYEEGNRSFNINWTPVETSN